MLTYIHSYTQTTEAYLYYKLTHEPKGSAELKMHPPKLLTVRVCIAVVLVNCLGGLPRNSVDRLTDRARNDLKSVGGP